MNIRKLIPACRKAVVTGGFALAFPLAAAAADNVPPETLNIKVFPDHYVAAGKPFADLAALETWAKPILIESVWLDFCYAATTKQLVSLVERFHATYSAGMQVRTLRSGEAECISAGGLSTSSPAHEIAMLGDAEYLATDEFGRGKLP